MSTTYAIKTDNAIAQETPAEGAWYCGFIAKGWPDGSDRDGDLAKWDGVEFVGEDDEPIDMGDYDFLVKQG